MPTFTLTWQEALTRGPIFKRINERETLELKKTEFVLAQQKLECDLATVYAEWTVTRNVVKNNNQASL